MFRPSKIQLAIAMTAFAVTSAQAVPTSPLEAGKAKLAQGQGAQAVKLLEQAVKTQPNSCEAHLCLGKAYMKTKNLLNARTQFRAAIRTGKGSGNAQQANKLLMTLPQNIVCPKTGQSTRLLAANLGLLMRQRGIGGASPMPAVLDFYASWCQPCQLLKPIFDKAKIQYGDKIQFMSINVDDPSNEQLMDQYEVSPIPTTIFINKDGEVVSYSLGFSGDRPINEGISKILPPS